MTVYCSFATKLPYIFKFDTPALCQLAENLNQQIAMAVVVFINVITVTTENHRFIAAQDFLECLAMQWTGIVLAHELQKAIGVFFPSPSALFAVHEQFPRWGESLTNAFA
jgi:hypothetical protein